MFQIGGGENRIVRERSPCWLLSPTGQKQVLFGTVEWMMQTGVYVHGFGPDDFVQSGEGATFLQGVLGPVRIQEKGICISARCRAYVG